MSTLRLTPATSNSSSEPVFRGWFDIRPDGRKDFGVPSRLLRHPEVQRRGLELTDTLNPGVVFSTICSSSLAYVVKILNPDTEELPIYQRLLREIRRPNNHTLPAEITLDDHPLLIMPFVGALVDFRPGDLSPRALVDAIFQLVEGVEFLHSQHIAHLDICKGNVVVGLPQYAAMHETVVDHRLYIIDFNISRQFALGPGVQQAITLPGAQLEPPNGLEHFDPYSWDVYCAGRTLEFIAEERYGRTEAKPHWLALQSIKWLVGNERGCTGVCRCRPTARTALRVAIFLRWAIHAAEGYHWVVGCLSRLWSGTSRA